MMKNQYDVVVIGSGPNGYAAAIYLAEKKYSVLLIEGNEKTGGGMRTEELTLPGYWHDVCSTMHPLAVVTPFFNSLPLVEHGLKWIYPPVFLAHPFDDRSAAVLLKSIEETAEHLDEDNEKYVKLMKPLVINWSEISGDILGPLRIPKHPFAAARFGLNAIRSNDNFIKKFTSPKTKALFTGLSAHGVVPTNNIFTAAIGLVLAISAHVKGWPYAKGGSAAIPTALESYFKSLGGEIVSGRYINDINDLPKAKTILFNTSPRTMISAAGKLFSTKYINRLNKFKYGPAALKIDFALSEPVPFKDELCRRAGFVHLGGTSREIIQSEHLVFKKKTNPRPFVLFAQPTLFDPSRCPAGNHIAYAYCHVPNGYDKDVSDTIINQIERFAPGFRDVIISKSVITPLGFESDNPNYIGGDINGGMQSWDQLFTRPVRKLNPYKTSADGIFICSSSTPPGGGVHGMCGYNAAVYADKYLKRL